MIGGIGRASAIIGALALVVLEATACRSGDTSNTDDLRRPTRDCHAPWTVDERK
jgi:hypothetical protein